MAKGTQKTLLSDWMLHQAGRPNRLILIRHGESTGNVDRTITQRVPDNALHLTPKGQQDALSAGVRLKEIIGDESVRFIVSPYVRTQETFNGIAQAFGGPENLVAIEEPRIREIEYGNYDRPDIVQLHKEKEDFGAFFYRFPEGESPADVYDRASAFLETLYRMWQQPREDNYVVVGHGIMLLVLLQRFFGLTINDYYSLAHLENCEFIVLEKNQDNWYDKIWSLRPGEPPHEGLRRKEGGPRQQIWNGKKVGEQFKVVEKVVAPHCVMAMSA